MNDLKEFGQNRIKEIQAEIDKLNDELKERNKKIFEKIADLEADKAPILKLIRDFDKLQKSTGKASK